MVKNGVPSIWREFPMLLFPSQSVDLKELLPC